MARYLLPKIQNGLPLNKDFRCQVLHILPLFACIWREGFLLHQTIPPIPHWAETRSHRCNFTTNARGKFIMFLVQISKFFNMNLVTLMINFAFSMQRPDLALDFGHNLLEFCQNRDKRCFPMPQRRWALSQSFPQPSHRSGLLPPPHSNHSKSGGSP